VRRHCSERYALIKLGNGRLGRGPLGIVRRNFARSESAQAHLMSSKVITTLKTGDLRGNFEDHSAATRACGATPTGSSSVEVANAIAS
jgi:hypothetical protein